MKIKDVAVLFFAYAQVIDELDSELMLVKNEHDKLVKRIEDLELKEQPHEKGK